jgi:hypothetical protein
VVMDAASAVRQSNSPCHADERELGGWSINNLSSPVRVTRAPMAVTPSIHANAFAPLGEAVPHGPSCSPRSYASHPYMSAAMSRGGPCWCGAPGSS